GSVDGGVVERPEQDVAEVGTASRREDGLDAFHGGHGSSLRFDGSTVRVVELRDASAVERMITDDAQEDREPAPAHGLIPPMGAVWPARSPAATGEGWLPR